jgi:hypothetical protein
MKSQIFGHHESGLYGALRPLLDYLKEVRDSDEILTADALWVLFQFDSKTCPDSTERLVISRVTLGN